MSRPTSIQAFMAAFAVTLAIATTGAANTVHAASSNINSGSKHVTTQSEAAASTTTTKTGKNKDKKKNTTSYPAGKGS